MNPLLVDAFLELEAVEAEASKLEAVLAVTDFGGLGSDLDVWIRLQGIASVVEKIYSGLENVMGRIASVVDDNPVASTQGWHTALLRRMANPYADVRPAVIASDTLEYLNALRAFRHRERNTYGSHLDPLKVRENAAYVGPARALFRRDLLVLDAHLSEDATDGNDGPGRDVSGGPVGP